MGYCPDSTSIAVYYQATNSEFYKMIIGSSHSMNDLGELAQLAIRLKFLYILLYDLCVHKFVVVCIVYDI